MADYDPNDPDFDSSTVTAEQPGTPELGSVKTIVPDETTGGVKEGWAAAGVPADHDHDYVALTGDQTIAGVKTFSSPVRLPNGSGAAPALTFSNDPNTGIFNSSPDRIGISCGGNMIAQFGADVNGLNLSARDLSTDTNTGTKIGTAATQKLGFFGATPVARPAGVAVTAAGIHAALVTLGLIAA